MPVEGHLSVVGRVAVKHNIGITGDSVVAGRVQFWLSDRLTPFGIMLASRNPSSYDQRVGSRESPNGFPDAEAF